MHADNRKNNYKRLNFGERKGIVEIETQDKDGGKWDGVIMKM